MRASCLSKRGWNCERLLTAVNAYIAEVRPLLEGGGDKLAAGEYERLSGLTMRVATVDDDTLTMAIEGRPELAASFQPSYSVINGAVYVVSVRPGILHGKGVGRISQQVGNWSDLPGAAGHMDFGASGAHRLIPALIPPGPGVTAPEPDVSIFPRGLPAADGVPVIPGQVARLPRYLIELEVGNRGPTEIRRHLRRCFDRIWRSHAGGSRHPLRCRKSARACRGVAPSCCRWQPSAGARVGHRPQRG